jgi:ABC-type multidrug transport system permease subunit
MIIIFATCLAISLDPIRAIASVAYALIAKNLDAILFWPIVAGVSIGVYLLGEVMMGNGVASGEVLMGGSLVVFLQIALVRLIASRQKAL